MNIDFYKIDKEIQNCCKTTATCTKCSNNACLIGFSKNTLKFYFESQNTILSHGMEHVPKEDFKVYNNQDLIDAIVEILLQCKQCNEEHQRDCVINIIRVCLETALFGKNMGKYEGNSLSYIIRVIDFNPDIGNEIMIRYKEAKSLL